MANNRHIGQITENIATKYIENINYKILERNFRCNFGEIDIIADDNGYIVFIEVKYRSTTIKGLPREAVNRHKQKTIIAVAQYYIMIKNLYNVNFRFDVVELLGDINKPEINLIKNAFQL